MLTWCSAALFAGAALAAGRWRLRRFDTLGRVRAFPWITVVVLGLAGALLLVPVIRHARLEVRLATAASALVGHPVEVHCQGLGEAFVDTDQHAGFVAWGPDGVPERRTTLKRDVCAALDGYPGRPGPRDDQVDEAAVEAVHVLSHESRHMAGVTDEAQAECQAMQRDAVAARLLGADAVRARRLARAYWLVLYPRMPADYRSGACTPGGAWDEHLPDAPWDNPQDGTLSAG